MPSKKAFTRYCRLTIGRTSSLWIALGLTSAVALGELLWLGASCITWLVFVPTVVLCLVAAYLLGKASSMMLRSLYLGALILLLAGVGVGFKLALVPRRAPSEVISLVARLQSNYQVVSSEYLGSGIWEVTLSDHQVRDYVNFNEKTDALEPSPKSILWPPTVSEPGTPSFVFAGEAEFLTFIRSVMSNNPGWAGITAERAAINGHIWQIVVIDASGRTGIADFHDITGVLRLWRSFK